MLFVAMSGSVAESVRAALCGGGQGNAVVLLGAGLTGAQLIGRQHRQVCLSLVEQFGARAELVQNSRSTSGSVLTRSAGTRQSGSGVSLSWRESRDQRCDGAAAYCAAPHARSVGHVIQASDH
jgi:hypothetical protein